MTDLEELESILSDLRTEPPSFEKTRSHFTKILENLENPLEYFGDLSVACLASVFLKVSCGSDFHNEIIKAFQAEFDQLELHEDLDLLNEWAITSDSPISREHHFLCRIAFLDYYDIDEYDETVDKAKNEIIRFLKDNDWIEVVSTLLPFIGLNSTMRKASWFRKSIEPLMDELVSTFNSEGCFRDPAENVSEIKLTAMSLATLTMFQDSDNPFAETIKRGIKLLTKEQGKNGGWDTSNKFMYESLLTTICACSALKLNASKSEYLASFIEGAENWLLSTQNKEGLWDVGSKANKCFIALLTQFYIELELDETTESFQLETNQLGGQYGVFCWNKEKTLVWNKDDISKQWSAVYQDPIKADPFKKTGKCFFRLIENQDTNCLTNSEWKNLKLTLSASVNINPDIFESYRISTGYGFKRIKKDK